MNAGSSVTSPVFARRLAISIAFSFSVPVTTGASNDESFSLISTFSLTGGLAGFAVERLRRLLRGAGMIGKLARRVTPDSPLDRTMRSPFVLFACAGLGLALLMCGSDDEGAGAGPSGGP